MGLRPGTATAGGSAVRRLSAGLLLSRTAGIGLSAVTCMLAGAAALCAPALHRLPARRAQPRLSRCRSWRGGRRPA